MMCLSCLLLPKSIDVPINNHTCVRVVRRLRTSLNSLMNYSRLRSTQLGYVIKDSFGSGFIKEMLSPFFSIVTLTF
jgi:hypothetical protein